MRFATIALIGTLGLAASALSANAAPLAPATGPQASNIIQVAGGCGPADTATVGGTASRTAPGTALARLGRLLPALAFAERPCRQSPERAGAGAGGGGYYHRGPGWGY